MTARLPTRTAVSRRARLFTLAAAVAVATGGGLPATAGAAGAAFSITPVGSRPYFVFQSDPGTMLHGRVRVVNTTATAGEVMLYGVDATTGQTSGAVYRMQGDRRAGVGGWLAVSASRLRLGPHRSRVVSFTVGVPGQAAAGQHLGGLVAAPVTPRRTTVSHRGKRTFRVNIQEISVVAVQVDLPGPAQERLSITRLQPGGRPGYQTLSIGLANGGNRLLKGSGRLTVTRPGGARVLDRRFALDTIVPQTRIDFPVYVRGRRLPPGPYRAVVTIAYGHGRRVERRFGFAISSQQVRQTFGSTKAQGGGSGGGGAGPALPAWTLAVGGAALLGLGVGGSALYFRRGRLGG